MTVTPERTFISTIFLKRKDYLLLYLSYIIYYNNTIYIYNTIVKYILMFQFSVLKFFFLIFQMKMSVQATPTAVNMDAEI